ncbi:MAG: glycosyltransferase family 39 protein [Bacteroidota bacterium]
MNSKVHFTGPNIFYIFLAIWGMLSLVQSFFTPLHNDEAYYWMYSQYPAWGYYDHPPMIALMIGAGYLLLHNELGVRLIVVLSHLATLFIVWMMIGKEIKAKPGNVLIMICIIAILPVINIYSFLATPDPPLLFFTAVFLLFYKKFLKNESWLNSLFLGFAMAGLMYSKYHGALLIIIVIMSNLKLFRNPRFYIAVMFSLILFLPHILWQISNDFPSLKYHLAERVSGFDAVNIPEYLLNQILIHNPLILPLFLYLIIKSKPGEAFNKGLKYSVIGVFAFFFIASFRYHIEPQWTAIVTIPMVILIFNDNRIYSMSKFLRTAFIVLIPLFLFARSTLAVDFLPISFLKKEFHDNPARMKAISELAEDKPVVFTNSYQDPSLYSFYTGKFAHSLNNKNYRRTQYDLWPFEEKIHGKEVIYIPHWLNDYYRSHLSVKFLSDRDSIYCRIFRDFQSLQRECVIIDDTLWRFTKESENVINLKIFNPYPYVLDISHPELPVIFQAAFYDKYGILNEKYNLELSPPLTLLNPGDTVSVSCRFRTDRMTEGKYKLVILSEAGILYDTFISSFREVLIIP